METQKEIGKWVLFTRWMLKSWSVRYPHLKLQFGFIRNLCTWNSSHLNDTQKMRTSKEIYEKVLCLPKKMTSIEWEGWSEWTGWIVNQNKTEISMNAIGTKIICKFFGSICNNKRCKGEAKSIANYFISIVLIFLFPIKHCLNKGSTNEPLNSTVFW